MKSAGGLQKVSEEGKVWNRRRRSIPISQRLRGRDPAQDENFKGEKKKKRWNRRSTPLFYGGEGSARKGGGGSRVPDKRYREKKEAGGKARRPRKGLG